MAHVGYIRLMWSRVEQRLNEELVALAKSRDGSAGAPPHGLAAKIDLWASLQESARASDEMHLGFVRDLVAALNEARILRNAISHGMTGATGDPSTGEAFVETELSGKVVQYDYDTFDRVLLFLEQANVVIAALTQMALHDDADRSPERYRNFRHRLLKLHPPNNC